MSTILLTGASGFLGSAMLTELSTRHQVITIGRKPLAKAANQTHYLGNLLEIENLQQLNQHHIDAMVHLAAITGDGDVERQGIPVNVEGTRCLMQYLIGRGCRKFVNASSIAVVGMQSVCFRPLTLPMGDEHQCLDRDGYGFSKYMMEEVTRYLYRKAPEIDVINLRLAAIYPDATPPAKVVPCDIGPWAAGCVTMLSQSQAIKAFTLAVESELKPGVRILNAVSKKAWVQGPVIDVLRRWWGNDVDLSYFAEPNNAQASLYSSEAITRELGYVEE